MSADRLGSLRRGLSKLWLISPEKLWLLSIRLNDRDHWLLAFWVKQLNTILYHNSLAPGASVGPDVLLGHYSHGIVVHGDVVIGRRVKIWHNVTLTAGRQARGEGGRLEGPRARIIVENGVKIGTNAVVIPPRGACLRIGRGARIGAGAIVTADVPAGATVVSPPARVLLRGDGAADAAQADAETTAVGRADAQVGLTDASGGGAEIGLARAPEPPRRRAPAAAQPTDREPRAGDDQVSSGNP
jgi:serine O-acetyltransferase